MRRSFSILLILFFGLGPLSATIEGSDDAGLPACCRRHGAHHCAISMEMAAAQAQPDSTPAVSAPLTCPHYPGAAAALTATVFALVSATAHLPALAQSGYRPAATPTTALATPIRTHAGRGPPQHS
ncbi:MAG TPA: hypothetical protein VGF96_10115 [Terracidiphilus sp.]|jgi:hypothetical protein